MMKGLFHSGGVVPKDSAMLRMGEVPSVLYPYQREIYDRLRVPAEMLEPPHRTTRKEVEIKVQVGLQPLTYSGPIFKEPVGAYREMLENIDRAELTPASRTKRSIGYQMALVRKRLNDFVRAEYLAAVARLASSVSDVDAEAKRAVEGVDYAEV